MFDIDRFKSQLAETIAYCLPRYLHDDPKHSLRTLLPTYADNLDYDLSMRLFDPLVTIRSTFLEANKNQTTTPLPTDLAGGRLLIFYLDWAVYDPAAEPESNGYFNVITMPAWDTWVYHGSETLQHPERNEPAEYLICWIPPQLVDSISEAIKVDPTECIEWLSETKLGIPFLDVIRQEGLLR